MDLERKFREDIKKIKAYTYVLSLAGWDSNTEAPRNSFRRRGEMLSVLSKELFALETNPNTIDTINKLYEKIDMLDDHLQREVKKAKKSVDKIINIPEEEYLEYRKLINDSQLVWEDAKHNDDYQSFKGNLAKIVEFNKKFALYYKPDANPYDTLLDDYEEGMTMKEYDMFFDALKKILFLLLNKYWMLKKEIIANWLIISMMLKNKNNFVTI